DHPEAAADSVLRLGQPGVEAFEHIHPVLKRHVGADAPVDVADLDARPVVVSGGRVVVITHAAQSWRTAAFRTSLAGRPGTGRFRPGEPNFRAEPGTRGGPAAFQHRTAYDQRFPRERRRHAAIPGARGIRP